MSNKAAAAKRVENPIEDWEQDTALVDATTEARQKAAAAEIAETASAAVKAEAEAKPSKFSAAALRVSQDFAAGGNRKDHHQGHRRSTAQAVLRPCSSRPGHADRDLAHQGR